MVVTGGARGIGAALVRRFHAAGANVVVADVLDASPVAEPLERAVAVHADVIDRGRQRRAHRCRRRRVRTRRPVLRQRRPRHRHRPDDAGAGMGAGDARQRRRSPLGGEAPARRVGSPGGAATSAPRRRRPDCSPRSARSGTRSRSGQRSPSPSGCRSPTATRGSASAACARRGSTPTCSTPRPAAARQWCGRPAPCSSPTRWRRSSIAAIVDERFLVLPHPEVAEYVTRKASDEESWLAGMRRLQARIAAG